jgi:hypothetical protein
MGPSLAVAMPTRDPADFWYVRLPDGRVVRAKSTASVRHHLETGRLPADCWVRRSAEEDWITLDWAVEFADLASQKRKRPESEGSQRRTEAIPAAARELSARANLHELRTVGVPGMVEELLTALDSTLSRRKLLLASLLALLGGGVLVALGLLEAENLEQPWLWLWRGAAILILMVLTSIVSTLLTQLTFVELSRLRPARWHEVTASLGGFTCRLLCTFLLVGGVAALITAGLHRLPKWILEQELTGPVSSEMLAGVASAVSLFLEVLLWPVLGLGLLLGPILVVEECGVASAVGQWYRLIRRHLSRVFLYEALAAALGLVMSIPFLLPVLLAGWLSLREYSLVVITESTLYILAGLAFTPLIAYLIVANVFIYLNLRYELSMGTRD